MPIDAASLISSSRSPLVFFLTPGAVVRVSRGPWDVRNVCRVCWRAYTAIPSTARSIVNARVGKYRLSGWPCRSRILATGLAIRLPSILEPYLNTAGRHAELVRQRLPFFSRRKGRALIGRIQDLQLCGISSLALLFDLLSRHGYRLGSVCHCLRGT